MAVSESGDATSFAKQATDAIERQRLLVSIAFNAFVFFIVYSIYTPVFMTNDDVSMMLRAAGVSKVAAPSEMILFTHVAIGWALKTLYELAAHVPWYALYLSASLFAAHCAILYALLWRSPDLRVLGFFGLYYAVFGVQVLLQLQFTIAASYLCFAGFGLLFVDAERNAPVESGGTRQRLTWQLAIGVLLVVFGCMIRWRAMVMAAALFTPFFALLAVRPSFRTALARTWPIALAILIGLLAREAHEAVYRADPGWRSYREFNPIRNEFTDYRALERIPAEQREEVLAITGWTLNDHRMLRKRFFMNEALYSIDNFNTILDQLPARSRSDLPTLLQRLGESIRTELAIPALLLAAFVIIASKSRKENFLVLAGAALALSAVVLLLLYYYKPPPPRVTMPMLGYLILAPMLLYEPRREHSAIRALAALACLAPLVYHAVDAQQRYASISDYAVKRSDWLQQQIVLLAPQQSTLFVAWDTSFPSLFVLPFEDISYLKPMQVLGLGTAQRTPSAAKQLAEHEIDDLYLALATRDDVLLMTKTPALLELYATYMLQHYDLQVRWRPVFQAGPTQIFSIQSRDRAMPEVRTIDAPQPPANSQATGTNEGRTRR